jgi:hypothetical protein
MNRWRLAANSAAGVVLAVAVAACGSSSSSSDDDDDFDPGASTCNKAGPGKEPSSGSGTVSKPYIIKRGVRYGGCAKGDADPGPIYKIEVGAGTYKVTQSNGTSDIELWIYDEDGNNLDIIDDKIAGFDESRSYSVDKGAYGIEVFSNTSDSSFSLIVE